MRLTHYMKESIIFHSIQYIKNNKGCSVMDAYNHGYNKLTNYLHTEVAIDTNTRHEILNKISLYNTL